jgi:muramoyltetrapeptide carboxypeptidase LdcA involved in peptidoglycan recycling
MMKSASVMLLVSDFSEVEFFVILVKSMVGHERPTKTCPLESSSEIPMRSGRHVLSGVHRD